LPNQDEDYELFVASIVAESLQAVSPARVATWPWNSRQHFRTQQLLFVSRPCAEGSIRDRLNSLGTLLMSESRPAQARENRSATLNHP
jgi:hypothetical protein